MANIIYSLNNYLTQICPSWYCHTTLDFMQHAWLCTWQLTQGIIHLHPLWINRSPNRLISSHQGATHTGPRNTSLNFICNSHFVYCCSDLDLRLRKLYRCVFGSQFCGIISAGSVQPMVRAFLLDPGIYAGHHVATQSNLLTLVFLFLWGHLYPHGNPTLTVSSNLDYCQRHHLSMPLTYWVLEGMNTRMETTAGQTPSISLLISPPWESSPPASLLVVL